MIKWYFAVKRMIYEQDKYDTIKHWKALQQLAHQVMWSFWCSFLDLYKNLKEFQY